MKCSLPAREEFNKNLNKCAFKIFLEGLYYKYCAHKNNDDNNYVSFIGFVQHIYHPMSKVLT